MQFRIHRSSLASVLLLSLTLGVSAQQIYRIVGADGRVTFTDQPPAPSAQIKSAALTQVNASGPGSVVLPLELRAAVDRYPVALFTGPNCEPCDAGRDLLTRRGVPFSERTVTTGEDGDALKRLANTSSLPMMTVGSQQVKGFSDLEWNQFLTAAGYPSASRVPPAYRNPAAEPLVAVQKPAAAPTSTAQDAVAPRPAAPATPAVTEAAPNPAGIRF